MTFDKFSSYVIVFLFSYQETNFFLKIYLVDLFYFISNWVTDETFNWVTDELYTFRFSSCTTSYQSFLVRLY